MVLTPKQRARRNVAKRAKLRKRGFRILTTGEGRTKVSLTKSTAKRRLDRGLRKATKRFPDKKLNAKIVSFQNVKTGKTMFAFAAKAKKKRRL